MYHDKNKFSKQPKKFTLLTQSLLYATQWKKYLLMNTFKRWWRDFPGGPVVKNLPANTEDMGSIPSQETKILCLWATKPMHHNYWSPCAREPVPHKRSHYNGKLKHCN